MSKSTAVKNSTSPSGGAPKGGGLLLPDAGIEGVNGNVVPYALVQSGFKVVMPFYEQGYYYRFFLSEPDGSEIFYSYAEQAYVKDQPVIIPVPSTESLKLAGRTVALHWVYFQNPLLTSGTVVYSMAAS